MSDVDGMLDELPPEEMAQIEEMENSDAPIEATAVEVEPAPAEPADTPEAPAQGPEKHNPAQSAERPDGFVPKEALGEARHKARETQRQLDELNGKFELVAKALQERARGDQPTPPENQPPDKDIDPLGYLEWENKQLRERVDGFDTRFKEADTQQQQYSEKQKLVGQYQEAARSFAQQTPDFQDAYQFARQDRFEFHKTLMGNVPDQQIWQIVDQEEMDIARNIMERGDNPAEVIYSLAKQRGYTAKADDPAPTPQEIVEQRDKAASANTSLSQVSGSAGVKDTIDKDTFANMSEEQIHDLISRLGPEEASQALAAFG